MILQILPKLGCGAAAIGMALFDFGVWSLVGGRLVLEMLSLITIWHAVEWRPLYKFDRKAALEPIGYRKHIMQQTCLSFLSQ